MSDGKNGFEKTKEGWKIFNTFSTQMFNQSTSARLN
jgi:hypothetical protein